MSSEILTVPASMGLVPLERFTLRDVEEIRLVLRGGSAIDWRKLFFRDVEEVRAFLRLLLLDPTVPGDEARLREILAEAVTYLRTVFRYRVADAVAKPERIEDLFLAASGVGPHRRNRRIACIVLKVGHTIFHTDARATLAHTPISDSELAGMMDARIRAAAARMQSDGVAVCEFVGNVKTRESVLTKLLAKKETVAAQIFDKVRYRVVTERYEDILPALQWLTHHLFPFHFVVPGQTQNTLFSFRRLVETTPELARLIGQLQHDHRHEDRELAEQRRRPGAVNEFSGSTYRVLNFIADVPVRLDAYVRANGEERRRTVPTGPLVVFHPVEFQFMDAPTARENQQGENSHEAYKRRQRQQVLRRLSRGLVVPRRHEADEPEEAAVEPPRDDGVSGG